MNKKFNVGKRLLIEWYGIINKKINKRVENLGISTCRKIVNTTLD